MRSRVYLAVLSLALIIASGVGCEHLKQEHEKAQEKETAKPAAVAKGMDRTVLPIAEPDYPHETEARRARRQGAAAVRGEGAQGRAERHRLPDRRHRLRPREHVRRRHSHADARSSREPGAQVQPLPHHGALLADARGAPDRPQPPYEQRRRDHGSGHGVPGQHRARGRRASRRWPRSCARTATARPPSASITRRRRGKSACPDRSIAGPRIPDSTSSTASSAARPISGRR